MRNRRLEEDDFFPVLLKEALLLVLLDVGNGQLALTEISSNEKQSNKHGRIFLTSKLGIQII